MYFLYTVKPEKDLQTLFLASSTVTYIHCDGLYPWDKVNLISSACNEILFVLLAHGMLSELFLYESPF